MTKLLSPISAVRMVWAASMKFSSQTNFDVFEEFMKQPLSNIIEQAKKDPRENEYVLKVLPMISAALRNVDIIRKGRELNYADNKILRKVYLDSISQKFDITAKMKDFAKNLPAITIGGTGGLVLAEGAINSVATIDKLFFALLFAALGYGINQLLLKYMLYRKQLNYMKEDFETTCYFEHYLDRIEKVLHNLFSDLEELHEKIFDTKYHTDTNGKKTITRILSEVRSKRCQYIQKHMNKGIITPDIWHLCEIEKGREELCPHYKKENIQS